MPPMFLSLAGKPGRSDEKDKKKFLYERKGPWPQPSPRSPLGTAPEVLHLPKKEKREWQWHIGLRYLRDLFIYSPVAAFQSLRYRRMPELPDDALIDALTRGLYSRFLAPLDDIDRETFSSLIDESGDAVFYKMDFTPIAEVRPYDRMYVAPTISLIRRSTKTSDDFALKAIAIGDQRLVLEPGDGDSWALAKYYVLQGCSYATLFTEHPNVHFPFDTINAVTKGSIPTDHLLFQLLIPHLRFSLVLNNAVLQGEASVISNFRATIYDPFTAKASAGLMAFFIAGYKGIEGNAAYPAYRFPKSRDELRLPPTPYGEFLRRYFEPFLTFTTKVVAAMSAEELSYAQEWSRWIRVWIKTFPELTFRGEDVTDKDREVSRQHLAFALAVVLWDVTVVHSTDHENFAHDIPVDWKCFRLRQPAPVSKSSETLDRKKLSKRVDLFKSHLAHRMFFAPTTVTRLMEVSYDLPNALNEAVGDFREGLRTVEASLAADGIPTYLPLDEVAASIQY
jgi:hypothetical protein